MRGSKGMVGSGGQRKAWGMPPWATVESGTGVVALRIHSGLSTPKGWKVEDGAGRRTGGALNAKRPIKDPLCPLQLRGMHHLSAQVLRNRRLEKIQLQANAGAHPQLWSRRRSPQRSSRLLMNELLDFDFPAFPFRALPNAAPLRVAK